MTATATIPREQLRTFHLSGQSPDDTPAKGALRPTLLASMPALPDLEASYPMCVHPDGAVQSIRDLVGSLENAPIITSAFHASMNAQPCVPLADAAPAVIASLVECSSHELGQLKKLLPPGALLVGYHADSLLLLHAAKLAQSRKTQRAQFWQDVRRTAARLKEILQLDDSRAPGAVSAESVSASLGSQVGSFFNPSLLAKALQTPRNPQKRMDPERRSRCETTLAMLEEALDEAAQQPAFWLFHSGICGSTNAPSAVSLLQGEARWAVDSFAAALHFCDLRLDRLSHLLRALRVARLEIDSTFDPAVHEEMLARFDWQSATPAELHALPPIVVIETADYLGQASLTYFGRLLRSGLPVQVLVLRTGIEPHDLSDYTPDFGYLAIAHRESFVLQSSLARPSHLLPGLEAMSKTLRPAVAVIAGPRHHDEVGDVWLEDSLFILSRTFPLYSYNPDAGARWGERFQLLAMPAIESLTAAHVAAVSDNLRRHFHLVSPDEWTGEQMELSPYLDAYTDRLPLAIPYLWVEGPNGTQQRALLTRDLANYCLDRRRAWTLFEELGGFGKPQIVPDENARQDGAREAIERVIAMLTS